MDVQNLADELTVAKAKTVRTISIVALALSGAYFLEGIFSVLFALIPIPIFGFIISIILSVVEFALLAASAGFGVFALVRSISLVKELSLFPLSIEALGCAKLARTLSLISVIVTGFSFILLSILNIFELFLSFI